ncbi:hypothetical protein [Streptomyces sp. NPDC058671]
MSLTTAQTPAGQPEYGDAQYPFHITKKKNGSCASGVPRPPRPS